MKALLMPETANCFQIDAIMIWRFSRSKSTATS